MMKISDFVRIKREVNRNFNSAEEAIGAYSKMSEEELTSELKAIAESERQKGTLLDSDIEKFFNTVSPMITPEQREKLRRLIGEIMQ